MIPSINVNLSARHTTCSGSFHASPECDPILIPCPIPRSVTFSVVLGHCQCSEEPSCQCGASDDREPHTRSCTGAVHQSVCPARAVRVSCSISGKTWEESEVSDWEAQEIEGLAPPALYHTSRARWALIKALVLGRAHTFQPATAPVHLFPQRDAVYAALADMARAELAAYEAEVHWGMAIGKAARDDVRHPDPGFDANVLPSQRRLSAYIEHLIEQVGVLP